MHRGTRLGCSRFQGLRNPGGWRAYGGTQKLKRAADKANQQKHAQPEASKSPPTGQQSGRSPECGRANQLVGGSAFLRRHGLSHCHRLL